MGYGSCLSVEKRYCQISICENQDQEATMAAAVKAVLKLDLGRVLGLIQRDHQC